eukprot:9184470-Alexandrium_andersonii.AAC.1
MAPAGTSDAAAPTQRAPAGDKPPQAAIPRGAEGTPMGKLKQPVRHVHKVAAEVTGEVGVGLAVEEVVRAVAGAVLALALEVLALALLALAPLLLDLLPARATRKA